MYPVNQVILGGESMFNPSGDLDAQIQMMEAYKDRLQQLKDAQSQQTKVSTKLVWDEIDELINPMTNAQKAKMMEDKEYQESYNKIQGLVQTELLNLVKTKIESNPEGKELLSNQLKIVKRLKDKIIDDTNKEMELFNKFRDYSKNNPGVTYEEFIKANM